VCEKHRVGEHDDRLGTARLDRVDRALEVHGCGRLLREEGYPEALCGCSRGLRGHDFAAICWVAKHSYLGQRWHQFVQQLHALSCEFGRQASNSGEITTRSCKAADPALSHWITERHEHDRNVVGCGSDRGKCWSCGTKITFGLRRKNLSSEAA